MANRWAAGAAMAAALAFARAEAIPFIASFPGAARMTEEADAVALVEVRGLCTNEETERRLAADREHAKRPAELEGTDQYECCVVKTLKGELAPGDAVLALRFRPLPPDFREPAWTRAAATKDGFVPGMYLAFLQGSPALVATNCAGSVLPVPDGFDAANVDGMALVEAVDMMLCDAQEPLAGSSEARRQIKRHYLEAIGHTDRTACHPSVIVLGPRSNIDAMQQFPEDGKAQDDSKHAEGEQP